MFNKFEQIGHLTADVIMRYTPQGTAVAEFTLATNYKYGDTEETLFMPCVIMGKFAEAVGPYLLKGGLVFAEGRLREEKWTKDGQEHRRMKTMVSNLKLLGKSTSKPTEKTEQEAF